MAVMTSTLILSLIDRVTAPARGIEATLKRLQNAQANNTRRLNEVRGQMMDAVGAAYALYKGLSAPLNAAAKFEGVMLDIAQKADLSNAAMGALGKGIRQLSADLGKPVKAVDDWQACVEGADIVVEASRLPEPQPLLRTEWIKPGALVMPYGTMSAVELSLTDIMDKMVVDDWGQCKGGKLGSLRAHVESGRLSERTLHAELGQIAAGLKPGRESDGETILFWHRGLSLSDIALGKAMLTKAREKGIGQRLRFA